MFINAMLSSDGLCFVGFLRAVKFVFRVACERNKVRPLCERDKVDALRISDDVNPV
jgi:hypothetical protein